jgi:uncharacterized protein
VPLPALTTRVTDLTGTLDATQRGRLEAQAGRDRPLRARADRRAAAADDPARADRSFRHPAGRSLEDRPQGGKDDGLIIIVAKDDRKMRIEVGYGLEGSIPDAIAKRIIAERMAPAFKQGDFFGGLFAAVEALDAAIGGPASGSAPVVDAARVVPAACAR